MYIVQVFNEHPSRIISLEMIARLVSEAEDSLKQQTQVETVYTFYIPRFRAFRVSIFISTNLG